jgi:hypothetical protein
MESERTKMIATTAIAALVGVLIAIVIVVSAHAADTHPLVFGLPVVAAVANVLLWSFFRRQWVSTWDRFTSAIGHLQSALSILLIAAIVLVAISFVARLVAN